MQRFTVTYTKPRMVGKNAGSENGLQGLAVYYQSLFDIEENINHYNWKDYQNARRKFVKNLMRTRVV